MKKNIWYASSPGVLQVLNKLRKYNITSVCQSKQWYDLQFFAEQSAKAMARIANISSLQLYDCICLEIEMLQCSDITQLVAHASGISYQS